MKKGQGRKRSPLDQLATRSVTLAQVQWVQRWVASVGRGVLTGVCPPRLGEGQAGLTR